MNKIKSEKGITLISLTVLMVILGIITALGARAISDSDLKMLKHAQDAENVYDNTSQNESEQTEQITTENVWKSERHTIP